MRGELLTPSERQIAAFVAKRAGRSGAIWGAVFGVVVAATASGYTATFATDASRRTLALSFAHNPGIAALIGKAHRLDTVAGFTAWRSGGVLVIVGAIWGLFLGTRLLRGEEEAGRWELFLAGATTRRRATAIAMVGLAAAIACLWTLTALGTAMIGRSGKVGFSASSSAYAALALSAGAAVFVMVGALAGQLAATRRQANMLGGTVLGGAYLLRMVADSSGGVDGLRWVTPLGWVEELRPFTGSHAVALVPLGLTIALLGAASVVLAGRRDVGASALRDRPPVGSRAGLLGSVDGLTVRLVRGGAAAWVLGLSLGGLVCGLVAQSAAEAMRGSTTIEQAIGRIGGSRSGAAAYLGLTFAITAAVVACVAASQLAGTRNEEADGHLDNLLVRPVGRARWLWGRLVAAAALIVTASVAIGSWAWVGAASQHSGVGFGELVGAGLNVAPPALFVLGLGALAFGLWPRGAPALAYAVVAWSFVVQLIGSVLTTNRLFLDTSILHHVTPAPAAPPDWGSAAGLVGLGLLGAVGGIAAFRRRDLVTA